MNPHARATFINFAYGSNMCTRRLRERTPSAQPLGAAWLGGHRLMWHKIGADGTGKCDILETGLATDGVWGVLYEIAEAERPALDRAEGLGNGYEHKLVRVLATAGPVDAGAYWATHINAALLPLDWYAAFVLAGALEHGLPADYVARLRSVAAVVDANAPRRAENLAVLNGR
jgi:gamma-glutamylcyclotransferase